MVEARTESLSGFVHRAEEAAEAAQRTAQRRYAHAEAWRQMGVSRESDVSGAFKLLSSGAALKDPVTMQEARRETARGSQRREEYMRRRESADRALEDRNLRDMAMVHAHAEKDEMHSAQAAQRDELLARTRELEAARRALKADGASQKAAGIREMERLREKQEAELARIVDARDRAKDLSMKKRDKALKKREAEFQAALSARKREGQATQAAISAMRADEHMKKMELVWSTAEQVAQRCQRDYDEAAALVTLTPGAPTLRTEMERKEKKLEQARRRATQARQVFEAAAFSAGSPRSAPAEVAT